MTTIMNIVTMFAMAVLLIDAWHTFVTTRRLKRGDKIKSNFIKGLQKKIDKLEEDKLDLRRKLMEKTRATAAKDKDTGDKVVDAFLAKIGDSVRVPQPKKDVFEDDIIELEEEA